MNKILYALAIFATSLFVSCTETLPEANFELFEAETIAAIGDDGSATISWTIPDKASPIGYYLSWTSNKTGVEGGKMDLPAEQLSTKITDLTNDVTYTFDIQPKYSKGLAGKKTASCTPRSTRFVITNLVAASGTEKVRLSWTKPEGANLTGYSILVAPGNRTITVDKSDTEVYVVTGLTNNTEYTFEVTAVYTNGISDAVSATATPGLVYPITVAKNDVSLFEESTFNYNDMYFIMGEIKSVSWNFGDGSPTSTETSPKHAYSTKGTFDVTLTVTYADGTTEDGKITMTVSNYSWSSAYLKFNDLYGYNKVSKPVFSRDGRTMYMPTSSPNGHLFAIDMVSGTTKWAFEISSVTYGGGAIVGTDETIYQCGTDLKVYAIKPDGSLLWSTDVDGVIGAMPALSSGTLYCVTNGSTLYALNASTGDVKWTKALSGSTGGAIAVSGSTVYVGTNSNVYAFAEDGSQLWKSEGVAVTERGSFAISGTTLYAALKAKAGLAAINMVDGTIKWKYTTSGGDSYFPIVDSDGDIYFNEKGSKKIYAVHENGSLKWSADAGAAVVYDGMVLATNGNIYCGTQGKAADGKYKILSISRTDGTVTAIADSEQQIMGSATIGLDSRLYIGTIGSSADAPATIMAFDINSTIAAGWSVMGGDIYGTNSK